MNEKTKGKYSTPFVGIGGKSIINYHIDQYTTRSLFMHFANCLVFMFYTRMFWAVSNTLEYISLCSQHTRAHSRKQTACRTSDHQKSKLMRVSLNPQHTPAVDGSLADNQSKKCHPYVHAILRLAKVRGPWVRVDLGATRNERKRNEILRQLFDQARLVALS